MEFLQKTIRNQKGTIKTDSCARSGLAMPPTAVSGGTEALQTFSTVYTRNFEKLADFYLEMIGKENLKIEGDGMLVFEHGGGSIVLKAVEDGSQFAKLSGHQSIGLVGDVPKAMTKSAENISDELSWDTKAYQVTDPDGNCVIFAAADR